LKGAKKMKNKTEKAITQIPQELKKLTQVIATIGETLIDTRISKIKQRERKFREIVEKTRREQRKGVVPKNGEKMSYKRTKTINGNTYNYLVESKRINGKVIQKHLKYLGKDK